MTEDFRLLVSGSRRIHNSGRQVLHDHLDRCLERAVGTGGRLVVVQGECEQGGVDLAAAQWGRRKKWLGFPVEVEGHPARNHPTQDFGPWPGAGPNRNAYMVSLGADLFLGLAYTCNSVWCRMPAPHRSHGTNDCFRKAKAAGIEHIMLDMWKEAA
jgi:hypothetical protein